MTVIIAIGRSIIAYNSFFVCLVRYIYIVHRVKTNQWNFENIGRLFQIGSIVVPTLMPFFVITTFDLDLSDAQCGSFKGLALDFTQNYLPESLVHIVGMISFAIQIVVFLNIADAFLYIQIFRVIKR